MHLFLSAIGLKSVNDRKSLEKLLKNIVKEGLEKNEVVFSSTAFPREKVYPAQIKHYFNEVSGISVNGAYDPKKNTFKMDYYFPFLDGKTEIVESEISVGRKTDSIAYNILCDEPGRGIALIFYMSNPIDFINNNSEKTEFYDKAVRLSGMSLEGTILMPVLKSERQINKCKQATLARNNLIDLAKKGDSSAMDNLTIGDLDIYSDIFKRMHKEDILSIVDTSFIPSGFECDVYSVIGNITDVRAYENSMTKEEMFVLSLECNDIELDLTINKKDLLGEPEIGRRFKGKIWLQGQAEL